MELTMTSEWVRAPNKHKLRKTGEGRQHLALNRHKWTKLEIFSWVECPYNLYLMFNCLPTHYGSFSVNYINSLYAHVHYFHWGIIV